MLLAKKDEIDQLIQIIDSQNANYLTIIGLTIALFGIIFGIVQWRLSTQQIKRIKMEAQEGIRKEYHLDGMLKDISDFEDNLSELKSNFEKDKFERETSLETIIFEKIDLFTTVSSDSARANISNDLMNYLEEFRVFNIDDYIKNKMFDMFNHEIENTLLNNELNDYSKQLLRASQNIINKMQMEIKKKAKDNPVNDQSKQDE